MRPERSVVFGVLDEAREEADRKWGPSSGSEGRWLTDPRLGLAILVEEVGEVARAVLERDGDQVRAELVDVAQVAVAWLEAICGAGELVASVRPLGAVEG